MQHVFGKNIDFQGGEYGNAILSRFPIVEHTHTRYRVSISGEQRGLLSAVIGVPARRCCCSTRTWTSRRGTRSGWRTSRRRWRSLTDDEQKRPVIFCGDFNAPPGSPTYKALAEKLDDCWPLAGEGPASRSPAQLPAARIDYLFIDKDSPLRPRKAWVPRSTASDHLPVVVEFELKPRL